MQTSSSPSRPPSGNDFTGYAPPGAAPGYVDPHAQDPADTPLLREDPALNQGTRRRINRKGLLFVSTIGLMGALLLAWGLSSFSLFGNKKADKRPKSETVQLPEDSENTASLPPLPLPAASAPASAPVAAVEPAKPIPVQASTPTVVAPRPVAAAPAPSPMDMLTQQRSNGGPVVDGGAGAAAGTAAPAPASVVAKGTVSRMASPDTLLPRGTYIRCVLETRIITDVPGFTSCIVTEPVYSFSGRHLLIEKGSKVSGQYKMESQESGRVAVIWERVLTPNGLDVQLVSPGVDGLGSSGHPGHIDRHWGSRIGSALLVSLIGDAFQIAAAMHVPARASSGTVTVSDNGTITQHINPYQSQTAQTIQQAARSTLQQAANRPATVTINQGELVSIYASRDIDFAGVLEQP